MLNFATEPAKLGKGALIAVNAALPREKPLFTRERLVRSVKTLVREGMADKTLLDHTPKLGRKRQPATRRAMEIAAAFKSGRPKATLAEVAAELGRLKVLPPSGRAWASSSVKMLLDRAGNNRTVSAEFCAQPSRLRGVRH